MNRSALTDAMENAACSPGTWVPIRTYRSKRSAESMTSQLRSSRAARYRADGTWEFRFASLDAPYAGEYVIEAKLTPATTPTPDHDDGVETVPLGRGPGSLLDALSLVAERPGCWARLSVWSVRGPADDQASSLRNYRTAGQRKPGNWDFVVSELDDGRFGVWTRYAPAPPT